MLAKFRSEYCRLNNITHLPFTVGEDDLGDVLEELVSVSRKWYNIGIKLRVPLGTLDNIEYQYSDVLTCLRKMLTEWIKRADPLPTWEELADALESRTVGETTHAQQLRSKYCTSVAGM